MTARGFVAALVRLKTIALAVLMIFAPLDTGAQAAEAPRKLAVVSFGLFGDKIVAKQPARLKSFRIDSEAIQLSLSSIPSGAEAPRPGRSMPRSRPRQRSSTGTTTSYF